MTPISRRFHLLSALVILFSLNAQAQPKPRDDIAEECRLAAIQSVNGLLGGGAENFIETHTEAEIAQSLGPDPFGPWALAMSPSPKGRMGGLQAQMTRISRLRASNDPANTLPLRDFFEQVAASNPTISPETRASLHDTIERWRAESSYDKEIQQLYAGAPYFCSYFPLTGCTPALQKIVTWMHPHAIGGFFMSELDLWEKVLLDPQYFPGAAKGAAILYDRISSVRLRGKRRDALSDLFTDLVAGYLAVGKSQQEAKFRAMDVLGLYGTRGASLDVAYQLGYKDTYPLLAALAFMASATSYLDALQPANRYYSYPNVITGDCAYGKPYHFWMAVYHAHALMRPDSTPKAAAIASHLSGMLYESYSHTVGRDPNQCFYESLFSLHNNQLRTNLVVNDAGAIWAAEQGTRPVNLNASINLLKSKAQPLPPMTPDELQKLLNNPIERDKAWLKIFAPHTLMKEWLQVTKVRG